MANQKNIELFELMDELASHKEELDRYAINRTRSGNRFPNRLEHIGKHAAAIESIASAIQKHVQTMRRD
jgi:hypothetical protein